MKHRFRYTCYDATALLSDVNKLSTFMNRVNKQSQEDHHKGWSPDEYKGMAFEAMCEVLIKYSQVDKRVNIQDYRPHSARLDGSDVGIDGYGINHNGTPVTVQIKFRSNIMEDLKTKDSISNFVSNTTTNPKFKDADMVIFTTAKDLNRFLAEKMYHDRVRTLGYQELSKMTDGNSAFWGRFRKEMGVK